VTFIEAQTESEANRSPQEWYIYIYIYIYILKKDAGGSGLGIFTSRVLFQRSINTDTQLGTQLELSVGTNILLQINPALISMEFVLMAVHSLIIHVDHNRTLPNPSLITFLISCVHFF